MPETHFDRLDAYRVSVSYVAAIWPLAPLFTGHARPLAEQLTRAVTSIPLNIAEGAGDFSPADKARFYRYALRSTTETIAVLDVALAIHVIDAVQHADLRAIATRLVAMLTRLTVVTRDRANGRERERERSRKRKRESEGQIPQSI
jgi:four helix bundle protein